MSEYFWESHDMAMKINLQVSIAKGGIRKYFQDEECMSGFNLPKLGFTLRKIDELIPIKYI